MSSWDTSTGLLEAFQLEVQETWFGTNDKYNQGKTLLLNLKGAASVDGDVVDPEYQLMLSCGDKWTAASGGASAVNTAGSEMFNEQSAVGRLIDGIKNLDASVLTIMQGRGESFEADTWNNLVIDFERRETGSFKDRETGETREIYTYVPLTLVESGTLPGTADVKSEGTPASNSGGSDKALRVLVNNLAKKYDNNDDFVAAALDPDVFAKAGQLEANEELLDAVIDGSLFAEAN